MLDHESHPLQDALSALESSFSDRLIHPHCVKERFRRSFLPAAVDAVIFQLLLSASDITEGEIRWAEECGDNSHHYKQTPFMLLLSQF
ncbi:hypothetical protein WMY93_016327 [Mugilogobius chulae]|uniref:Uncharacterized protein n=1 Tax=Mugilogobius chulae TaxID=88201 RepID=A0AAW0NT75_9GOBI